MTRIKICGITRPEDALAAVECGVDALGLNFWPESTRYITPDAARTILEQVPEHVLTVGVFVDAELGQIQQIAADLRLDNVQLHGDEPPEILASLDDLAYKAFRLRGKQDFEQIRSYLNPLDPVFLVDSYQPGSPGGTGQIGDWVAAQQATALGRMILAGGLTPQNVTAALEQVHPWAVDVASGVESAPGIKDRGLMQAFVQAVREWDRTTFKRLVETDE